MKERISAFMDGELDERAAREAMDSLPGVFWHLTDAWRRRQEPNVLLVHYDDLLTDLEGQMRRVAAWLGIEVPAERWATLVEAATFVSMLSASIVTLTSPSVESSGWVMISPSKLANRPFTVANIMCLMANSTT